MKKTELTNERKSYVSPFCKEIILQAQRMLCSSDGSDPYGEPSNPGKDMDDDEEYTYDF